MHAVSPTVNGKFVKTDTVMGIECHNPSTIIDPNTGEWLLFHIGDVGGKDGSSKGGGRGGGGGGGGGDRFG